jgi:hypothetical protein
MSRPADRADRGGGTSPRSALPRAAPRRW